MEMAIFLNRRALVPRLGDDIDHYPTHKILDWRLMIEDW